MHRFPACTFKSATFNSVLRSRANRNVPATCTSRITGVRRTSNRTTVPGLTSTRSPAFGTRSGFQIFASDQSPLATDRTENFTGPFCAETETAKAGSQHPKKLSIRFMKTIQVF